MIELRGVVKSWSHMVLDHIDMKIAKGDFLYVIGDSGAGKSTLLKMIYGEEKPDRGVIDVMGVDMLKADSFKIQALRRRMGIVFQELRLIEELSAYDNIALSLETAREEIEKQKISVKRAVDEILQMVSLGNCAHKKIKNLSGGEKQRVAAARALVRRPEILIADEPTGGLDREQTFALMDLFQKINMRGTTVILATHDREIVRRIRKKSCVLKNGRITMEEGISLF